jgi:LysM repeat protein
LLKNKKKDSMPALGQLHKLKLKAYSDPEFQTEIPDGEFSVQVNPETYTVTQSIEYNQQQAQGTSSQQQRYTRSGPQNMDFEFIFDGTGVIPSSGIPFGSTIPGVAEKPNIIEAITKFKKVVYDYDGQNHEPPYVKIFWGTLLFNCRLTNLAITYKLFNADGTPIRAVAKCTFNGTVEDNLRVALTNPQSPDLTHMRTVRQGDTLPLMTYRIYGDESLYLEIARVNNLSNFRELKAGEQLFFPPVDKKVK